MTDPLPAKRDFTLRRGDTRVWQHQLFESPPAWAASTAYSVGVIGSGAYVAGTTVTFGTTSNGTPIKYTCTTAHTSGATFDATKWTADTLAVGAPRDVTDWVFLSQYRVKDDNPTGAPTAAETVALTDPTNGIITRTLAHTEAAKLVPGVMVWDLQATEADGTTVTTFLYSEKVTVQGDVSR